MNIDEVLLSSSLSIVVAHDDEGVEAEPCRPECELYEVLEASLRNDACDPRTEMIHLVDTAVEFAAMMDSI